ncbi:hypothetical protein [Cellulomonas sp. SG140]|uniref:hypothetical protein n=1 Tax=Cellulomonas sp. SG140 TaxID=2976536 RepID=UPI0021E88FD2|nr:hypothetical protein [Cellulomonas sp. SG140]
MTTLSLARVEPQLARRAAARIRDLGEQIYFGRTPSYGPDRAGKLAFVGYVVGSVVAWSLATLLVTGVLAAVLR